MAGPDPNNKPRLIAFEVTRRCRYNCKHCRAEADRDFADDELTTEQCKKIIDAIASYHRCVLILTGGEPTERSDLCELVRHAAGTGLWVAMATCGYAIDEARLAALKEAGITALSISLDGATAQTHDAFRRTPGAFDAAVRAAAAARKVNLRFQINTTITRSNLVEVPVIADLAHRLGAYCFNPFILVPTGRGEEIADEILQPKQYAELLGDLLQMKSELPIELRVTCGPQYARLHREASDTPSGVHISGCMGGRGFGFISCHGDVQTCGFLDLPAGNLIENGYDFAAIWEQSKLLNEIRDLSSYKGRCGRCAYARLCGGCRARAYALTGDYLAEDPICWYESKNQDSGSTSPDLTAFQRRLCNRLQQGLPIDLQPFARLANELGCSETDVLDETRRLRQSGVIRRIAAMRNHRALGLHSTLVAAAVPRGLLPSVIETVNGLAGVSHNYLRRHKFNLWFTLQDRTPQRIDATLAEMGTRFGVTFHSLPVVNVFKLDVRFDIVHPDQVLLEDVVPIPSDKPVRLNEAHRQLLSQLQGGIEVIPRPFDRFTSAERDIEKSLVLLRELIDLGVVRRIAAVLDHRRLGFTANVLFAVQSPKDRVVETGTRLARFGTVSHCYERRTFEGWPYNLFAMLHGRNMNQIERTVEQFLEPAQGQNASNPDIQAYELLPTEAELKKQPVQLSLST
jgi:radical SAM protein with 4Fe4S-binding SPASM domain